MVFRASSIGGCLRETSLRALAYEENPDPVLQEKLDIAAREGARHEEWVIEDLCGDGWVVWGWSRQAEVTLPVGDSSCVVGHIDGLATPIASGDPLHDMWLLEVKALSRFRAAAFEKNGFDDPQFRRYLVQAGVYLRGAQCLLQERKEEHEQEEERRLLGVAYVVKCRDTGVVRVHLYPKEKVEEMFAPLWERVQAMARSVEAWEVYDDPEWQYDGSSFTCRACAFSYYCGAEVSPLEITREATSVVREDCAELVRRYLALQAENSRTEKEMREIRDSLSVVLEDEAVESIETGEGVVRWRYGTRQAVSRERLGDLLRERLGNEAEEVLKQVTETSDYRYIEVRKGRK